MAARLFPRWLPRLGALRQVSTSPVAHKGGAVSSDARAFGQMLRRDWVLVGLFLCIASVGGYTITNVSQLLNKVE